MSLIRKNRIGRRWLGLPVNTPKSLFNNSENGFVHDFSDPRSLFQDAAGATPVTAPEHLIYLAADKSRVRSPITSYAAVQASLGWRPKWGRAPKSRRQLWRGISSLSSGWATAGATPPNVTNGATQFGSPCVAVAFDQTMTPNYTNCRALSAQQAPHVAGRTYATAVDVCLSRALTGGEQITVQVTGANGFTPINLTAANSAAYVGQWVRLVLPTGTPAGSGNNGIYTYLTGTLASAVTIYLKDVMWEEGVVNTNYQAAASAFDITESGYPSFGFARLDGTDDVLSTVLTLTQTGDVLLFGRNGSYIEPGRVFAGGAALAIGPTGTSITPGLLTALGDLVGIVAIGRTLSTDERNRALRYFQAAGAAGFLTSGAELVANGDFDVNTTGWLATNGTIAAVSGELEYTSLSGSNNVRTSVAVVPGTSYLFTFRARLGTMTALRLSVYNETGVANIIAPTAYSADATMRQFQAVFTAPAGCTTASVYLTRDSSSTGTAYFDNASVKPLTAGA